LAVGHTKNIILYGAVVTRQSWVRGKGLSPLP